MSSFSEQLRSFIDEREIKIYTLSKQSGVNRTFIQKILSGERIPKDKSIVLKLASSLLLSPSETAMLIRKYNISKMGESKYTYQKFIKRFFNKFSTLLIKNTVTIQTVYQHKINMLQDTTAVYGNLQINNLVKTILELETMKKNGVIKIIAQPEYSFLFEILSLIGTNHSDLSIFHILCFDNSKTRKETLYNLNCIYKILPVFITGCNYYPMCYYDNVASHFSNVSILPYLIITSDYVINISYDISYATISETKSYIDIYNNEFDKCTKKSTPMLDFFHYPIDYIKYFNKVKFSLGDINYLFTYGLFPIYFINEKMLHKYIDKSLPTSNVLLEETIHYIQSIQNSLISNTSQIVYFSEEGLDNFLITGKISGALHDFYSPLDIKDRYDILKSIYEMACKDKFHPIIVKTSFLKIPKNLSIIECNRGIISSFCTDFKKKYISFVFNEKSIIYATKDFLDYLKKSDMVLSHEETIEVIKEKLENF